MKYTLYIFFLFWSITISAQRYRVDKITDKNPNYPEEQYIFPILKGGDSDITSKINTYLYKHVLQNETPNKHKSIFENVWKTSELKKSILSNLNFEVNFLTKKIYSVTINGKGCSDYCDYYTNTYNFDLQTGKHITLKELFTETGQDYVLEILNMYKKERIELKLMEINEFLNYNLITENEKKYYSDMHSLYSGCVTEYTSLDFFDFSLGNKGIHMFMSPCGMGNNQSVDELGVLEKYLTFEQLKEDLSDFCKEKMNLRSNSN